MSKAVSNKKNGIRKPKCISRKTSFLILIVVGMVLLVGALNFKLFNVCGWVGISSIIVGLLLWYIDSKYDSSQLKSLFEYDDELDRYKSLLFKNYDKREDKHYQDWKKHIECNLEEVKDKEEVKNIENLYWRLKTERDRKKWGIDNWKTILAPMLIALIVLILEISSNTNIELDNWKEAMIISLIIGGVIGELITTLVNGYNQEISFIEDLMKIVDEKYHIESRDIIASPQQEFKAVLQKS